MRRGKQAIPNNYLRRERELRGWSQQMVALHIGAERYYISRWECGTVSPSAYYRVRLCALFGKNAQELGLLPAEQASTSEGQGSTSGGTSALSEFQSLWFVPHRRNLYFTGREALLCAMSEKLCFAQSPGIALPLALCGLAGIGKTQTTIEYVYRFRARYQAVLWIRASSHETLVTSCQLLTDFLNLSVYDTHDQSCVIAALRNWLSVTHGWLLILDAVEDIHILSDLLPPEYIGHVLLTTRSQVLGTLAEPLNLDMLSLQEGVLLLLRRARIIDIGQSTACLPMPLVTEAQAIIQAMNGLPLALDQAGAYIDETQCTLSQYMASYRSRSSALLCLRGVAGADSAESVTTTLTLSIDNVIQMNPAALDLLRLCAFLHTDALPEEICTGGAVVWDRQHVPVIADSFALDQAIKALRRFSLIERHFETNTLTMHRLPQVVLRSGMDREQQYQWAERAVRAVNVLLPEEEPATREVRVRWQRLLPQAFACATLIAEWKITHPAAIRLLYRTGVYLFSSGFYAESERIYQQALALCRQVLGDEDEKVGEILNDLAVLLWYQGRYHEAEPLYQQALTICERALGKADVLVLHIRHNQALLCSALGQDEHAKVLFQETVHLRERVLGPSHPQVAESLHELSRILRRQQRLEEAEPLARRALFICQQALGEDHSLLARSLTHLGKLLAEQGQVEQAESLIREALRIRETTLGLEHPDVAINLNALGDIYCMQGKYEQAERVLQQAYHIRKCMLPADHPLLAETLHSLAQLASIQA